MKTDIGRRWVNALRSGNYKQGKAALKKDFSEDGAGAEYCCLGVLCDLYSQEFGVPWEIDIEPAQSLMGESEYLPPAVAQWAGLPDTTVPSVSIEGNKMLLPLTAINDDFDYDFEAIAELIETQLIKETT